MGRGRSSACLVYATRPLQQNWSRSLVQGYPVARVAGEIRSGRPH